MAGNYQSGISVVEFNDPANAREVAFADPAPLPHPTNPNSIVLGGDWSSHWYNGLIYESDIRRGLGIWELDDPVVEHAKTLPFLNPQSMMRSFATFPGAEKNLGELFDDGGITVGLEGKIANALEKAKEWLELPKKGLVALSHLDRAIHLLLWQADVIENKDKPNQGDPDGLRDLAATIQSLRADLTGFETELSGREEVPANDSTATGEAIFRLSEDGTALEYELSVNITDVTQAHIHLAPAGSNGGVVVWLYPSAPPAQLIPGRTSGVLATGSIDAGDLRGALTGQPLSALLAEINAGNAYVNVHTSQFPGGEIRGQL